MVAAYADRSASPEAASCHVIAGRFACGSHLADRPPGRGIEPVQSSAPPEATSSSTHRRGPGAPARAPARAGASALDESVTIDSGTTILGRHVPTTQGLIASGVTSNAGRRFSPICSQAVASIAHTAGSVTGRQIERRRRRTHVAPRSCSPMTSTPANQTAARIWPTGTSLAGGSRGDVLSCACGAGVYRRGHRLDRWLRARSCWRLNVSCRRNPSFESRETTTERFAWPRPGPVQPVSCHHAGRPADPALPNQPDEVKRAPRTRRSRHNQQPENDDSEEPVTPPREESVRQTPAPAR